MGKGRLPGFIFAVFVSVTTLFSESFDASMDRILSDMTPAGRDVTYVGMGVFHYADKALSGRFSSYLESKLSAAVLRNSSYGLVDRDKLDLILDETRFGLSGLIEESSRLEPGKLKGLQAIISGRYYDESDSVRIFLELLDLESGTVSSTGEIRIARREIPRDINVIPDNYGDALTLLEELAEVDSASEGLLSVKAWTRRGNGGTYHNGENLVINFYSSKDCYIKIYHIDVEGTISLIFPNHIYSDNFISANRIYRIPDARYNFNFELSPPFGTEFVKVIASVNQFEFVEESFEKLDMISETIQSRGLRVTEKEDQVSELTISYTIIE